MGSGARSEGGLTYTELKTLVKGKLNQPKFVPIPGY